MTLQVPAAVWAATLAHLRACGGGRRECVVYWVATPTQPNKISRGVHPVHTATAVHYQVDDAWLTRFWIELGETGEQVRVQVHTHGGEASHSRTDNEGALVYQPGFLSLVLPEFALRDDCAEDAFLAELDARGRWRRIHVPARLTWT